MASPNLKTLISPQAGVWLHYFKTSQIPGIQTCILMQCFLTELYHGWATFSYGYVWFTQPFISAEFKTDAGFKVFCFKWKYVFLNIGRILINNIWFQKSVEINISFTPIRANRWKFNTNSYFTVHIWSVSYHLTKPFLRSASSSRTNRWK